MTRGVLIFAQNNAEVDYAKMAIFAANRVKKHLDVPVSIVTDNRDYLVSTYPEESKVFDQIIDIESPIAQRKQFHDGSLTSKVLEWKNFSRSDAYDVTPYDETIIIDADYIINTNHLGKLWGSHNDLMMFRNSYDLAQWRDVTAFEYVNQFSIPFYWATVVYFQKTSAVSAFFKLVQHIRTNWNYYKILYSLDSHTFRNDFAFSIAAHILNDSRDLDAVAQIPGKMYYTLDKDLLVKCEDDSFTFLLEKEKYHGEYTAMKVSNLDVHIMNKYSLARLIDEQ